MHAHPRGREGNHKTQEDSHDLHTRGRGFLTHLPCLPELPVVLLTHPYSPIQFTVKLCHLNCHWSWGNPSLL